MKRVIMILTIVAACTALIASAPLAQDDHSDHGDKAHGDDMAAYMQQYMKAIEPVGHHKALAARAGEWNAEIRQWQTPGTEPTVSKGKATNEMVMGGRYLVQHLESDFMGMPYLGMGMSGFDKTIGKHTTFWIDNMGTTATYSEGECGDHCKTESYTAQYRDPVSGQASDIKMVTTVVDDNKHVFEMHTMGPDGNMFKSLEIIYTRG